MGNKTIKFADKLAGLATSLNLKFGNRWDILIYVNDRAETQSTQNPGTPVHKACTRINFTNEADLKNALCIISASLADIACQHYTDDNDSDDNEPCDGESYDGGFGPGSYFQHAMEKDD
jgi:hypothetical protein